MSATPASMHDFIDTFRLRNPAEIHPSTQHRVYELLNEMQQPDDRGDSKEVGAVSKYDRNCRLGPSYEMSNAEALDLLRSPAADDFAKALDKTGAMLAPRNGNVAPWPMRGDHPDCPAWAINNSTFRKAVT
jgi:hypothetical protein